MVYWFSNNLDFMDKERLKIIVRNLEILVDSLKTEIYSDSQSYLRSKKENQPKYDYYEIFEDDAKELIKNGCFCVCEGANMPTTIEAYEVFKAAKILYAPGKASNAGGVATSGLEMSQNSMRLPWPKEEVDKRLHEIMVRIHNTCVETAERFGAPGNYVNGANIAGFLKVADAMIDQGLV